jgi:hypothetical protein
MHAKIAGTAWGGQVPIVNPMRVLRTMSLALGLLPAFGLAWAQPEGVPSIFSDVAPTGRPAVLKLEVPESLRPRLPLSSQVRTALNERVTVAVAAAPAVAPRAKREWADVHGDAIVMDRFFVNAQREKKVPVENVPGYLMKAFTTGEIFHFQQGGVIPDSINWGLSEVNSTGYGTARSTPRFELFARWKF